MNLLKIGVRTYRGKQFYGYFQAKLKDVFIYTGY